MLPERHHPFIRLLHWPIAALVLAALIMSSFFMPTPADGDAALRGALLRHMSTGGLIALLMTSRLIVRRKAQRPPSLPSGMDWADRLASTIHPLLDILVVLMLMSGVGMALAADLPAAVFTGHGSLPNDLASLPLHAVHAFIAKMMMAALALHIGGALYHQFVLRDGLIQRIGLGRYTPRTRRASAAETCLNQRSR